MNVRREPDLWLLYLPRVSEEYPRQKLTDLEIVPCPVKRGKKATIKTLVRACTSYAGNTVLISRKDGCNVQASGCPMTCGLTCCLSTGEFAEVITSIILLPGQPHNTHTDLGFNESPGAMGFSSMAGGQTQSSLQSLQLCRPSQGMQWKWDTPSLPSIPAYTFSKLGVKKMLFFCP